MRRPAGIGGIGRSLGNICPGVGVLPNRIQPKEIPMTRWIAAVALLVAAAFLVSACPEKQMSGGGSTQPASRSRY
jgi:predicted small secreted protein